MPGIARNWLVQPGFFPVRNKGVIYTGLLAGMVRNRLPCQKSQIHESLLHCETKGVFGRVVWVMLFEYFWYMCGWKRTCLVSEFKLTFSHFKQYYTHFHTLFHPHVFQKAPNNTTLPNTPKVCENVCNVI